MCTNHFDWILDDVAVGNIHAGTDLEVLQKNGIDVIVCALPELPHPLTTYAEYGFSLLHIPVDDAVQVDLARWFDDAADFIMAHRMQARKTLVHCYAGASRSVALVCAFLICLFRCDHVKAMHWIRTKRPCAQVNPGFMRQLTTYGAKYKSGISWQVS